MFFSFYLFFYKIREQVGGQGGRSGVVSTIWRGEVEMKRVGG
jgi:hypothetical protein